MTAPKLAPSPADGHGLTDRITGPHYAAYSKGEPIELIPFVGVLKVAGHGGHDTANGRVNTVKYEVVRLEPILEPSERDEMLWKVQSLYEARTSTGSQRPLPIGLEAEERRLYEAEKIQAWADAEGISDGDLAERWRSFFGIGDDPDANYFGIPGDWRTASYSFLLQFAIEVGADSSDSGSSDEVEEVEDPDALDHPDDDPLAEAEQDADATA